MSVTDPVGGMHALFRGVLPEHVFAPRPPGGLDRAPDDPELVAWERETRALYAAHADSVAAVIVEPVLQGAGGMHVYSPHVLEVLHELAREHGALVIHDEIATGFHRTGPLWAGPGGAASTYRSTLHRTSSASARPSPVATSPSPPCCAPARWPRGSAPARPAG